MELHATIPVRVHGYTGQYDRYESYTRTAEVTLKDGKVSIILNKSTAETIEFSLAELTAAVAALT